LPININSSTSIDLTTFAFDVNNLTLTGSANINAVGNSIANLIVGNSANNVIDGGTAGNDTLKGGKGNDTYLINHSGVSVIENLSEGTDIVQSSVDFTLGSNIENLTLLGTTATKAYGNILNNLITGNTLANILSGGGGKDTLIGGIGNDTYLISNTGIIITENSSEGTDIVESTVSFTMANNIENLTLVGNSAINGTGNSLVNTITGNSKNNIINSGTGNAADTLIGGLGNDTYLIASSNVAIKENAGGGADLVISSVSYTLSNDQEIENLTITGSADTAIGNSLTNIITGNSLNNNLSPGGGGSDTLIGGKGNDGYFILNSSIVIKENSAEGTDTVLSNISYTLANNVENLTLTNITGAIIGAGNSLKNVIIGNTFDNIISSGGGGNDTFYGGMGNDTYLITNTGVTIVESTGMGTDIVESTVSFTLANNIENLTLTISGTINGTGNSLANIITGNSKNNIITSGFNGGASNDTLIGGKGNDTYIVTNFNDEISELSGNGTDLIILGASILSGYTLGAELENLTLNTFVINAKGNTLTNIIKGNSAANIIDGGTAGSDTLIGAQGNDTYIIDHSGVVITETSTGGTELIQSSTDFTLANYLENLTLSGTTATKAYGNIINNLITGNTLDNIIASGGGGKDTLIGGIGNDTYLVTNSGVSITENSGQGTDIVESTVSYTMSNNLENLTLVASGTINGTGNSLNNIIIGNSKNNIINAGIAGNDTLIGGKGNDTYIVDHTGPTLTENAGEGTDLLMLTSLIRTSYRLDDNLDNLTLVSTVSGFYAQGNTLTNIIKGNSLSNILDGGTAGSDTLIGAQGNDTYIIDHSGVVITETSTGGTELIESNVSYTIGNYLENLTLTGTSAINGTGNILANRITGNSLANIITSGGGLDTLIGGNGDDSYIITNTGVVITELSAEGTDLIQSSISYTLGNYIENLTLTGINAVYAIGNSLTNIITGNSKNNILKGGTAGNDTLIGGKGNDTYYIDNTNITAVENSGEGTDLVISSIDYTLGANLEKLTLTGTDELRGKGNSLDNLIIGNSEDNYLNGGSAGNDTLIGGLGWDEYTIDHTGITIIDNDNGDGNEVYSFISYTLSNNIYGLYLAGNAVIGMGNTLDNNIEGNSVDNILYGGIGNDYVYGGTAGADTLIGGLGNDIFTVEYTGITIVENANEGTDTIDSYINYTLSNDNIENLLLQDDFGTAIIAKGNTLNNHIAGNMYDNLLDGGTAGTDELRGEKGNDTYIIDHSGVTVNERSIEGTDIVESKVSYTLDNDVENLTLTGVSAINGVGNSLTNIITGNSLVNIINAGTAGDDTLVGGKGDDTYIIDHSGVKVIENSSEGTDMVLSDDDDYWLDSNIENLTLLQNAYWGTGNNLNNIIIGNTLSNTLQGLSGADTIYGGIGDDLYVVDGNTNAGLKIIENADEGFDTVRTCNISYTLANNLEELWITGATPGALTGNSLANNFWAVYNAANTLIGGLGDDTYVIQYNNAKIIENSGEGFDIVKTDASYTISNNIEQLILKNAGGSINGTGNSIANIITGNSFTNIIDGGTAGDDTLIGGIGNDTYYVDHTGVTIIENNGEGFDQVVAFASYTMANNIEDLTLNNPSGTCIISGNSSANTIYGYGIGDSTISGGTGNDTLCGGIGAFDTFVFSANDDIDKIMLVSAGVDKVKITDVNKSNIAVYNSGSDLILSYASDNSDIITIKNYS